MSVKGEAERVAAELEPIARDFNAAAKGVTGQARTVDATDAELAIRDAIALLRQQALALDTQLNTVFAAGWNAHASQLTVDGDSEDVEYAFRNWAATARYQQPYPEVLHGVWREALDKAVDR